MADTFDRAAMAAGVGEAQMALVSQSPASQSAAENLGTRVGTRDSLFLVAQLRLGDEQRVREVRVRNLSERGLMLELDKVVAIATPVLLDLRGIGEVGGKVAWCTAGRIGVALDSPIDPKRARKVVGVPKPANTPFYAKAPSK